MYELFTWLQSNFIEIFGTITGLIYIYFSIKQSIWLWPLGIVTSLAYIYVFFENTFYADMSLQVYYFFISIYGWYYWLRGNKNNSTEKKALPIIKINNRPLIFSIIITIFLSIILGFILKKYTDAVYPFGDAFTAAASVTATWMLTKKYIEQWIIWIIIDAISAGMYLLKGMYPTVFLFGIYTILAVIGYYQWKKEFQNQVKNQPVYV